MLAAFLVSASTLVGVTRAPLRCASPHPRCHRSRVGSPVAAVIEIPAHASNSDGRRGEDTTLDVIIAGGGIGGLCTALVLLKMGYNVQVYEKTSRFRPFGGPIQIASNAAESIRRIDQGVYERILEEATVIGNRMNGLKDGLSDEWFATFDLDSPARKRGQVSSVVIDRPILQEILLERVGHTVSKGAEVISCETVGERVRVQLSTGDTVEGDLLVGSDGINSRVRDVFDPSRSAPVWSGYTCVAGMAYVVPPDLKEVGYKVWVGSRKYFVSVDVGGGRIQWYAFMNIPPGSQEIDRENILGWLQTSQFAGWSADVKLLLDNSPTEEVEQRDLYDRAPTIQWSNGRICLLGDAAHPMMPNLGQGGGMAIEDALVLGQELTKVSGGNGQLRKLLPRALRNYNSNRVLRAAAVQGLSRVSSAFLFQYQPPLDIQWGFPPKFKNCGPRSLITRACQGFLQHVAFPLQFEFLFSFPGAINPEVFEDGMAGDFGTEQATQTRLNPHRSGPSQFGKPEKDLISGSTPLREWFNQYW